MKPSSALAPRRNPLFWLPWIASVISSIGT